MDYKPTLYFLSGGIYCPPTQYTAILASRAFPPAWWGDLCVWWWWGQPPARWAAGTWPWGSWAACSGAPAGTRTGLGARAHTTDNIASVGKASFRCISLQSKADIYMRAKTSFRYQLCEAHFLHNIWRRIQPKMERMKIKRLDIIYNSECRLLFFYSS